MTKLERIQQVYPDTKRVWSGSSAAPMNELAQAYANERHIQFIDYRTFVLRPDEPGLRYLILISEIAGNADIVQYQANR